jgi:F0F1-type ATP synthase assembly protein I|tara:strand:- start:1179 stop:1580 length:402 start_codon:yes stop_codon:yes gene_type:complete
LNGSAAISILRAAKRLIFAQHRHVLVIQLQVIIGSLSSLGFLGVDVEQSYAALIGALTIILPSAYLAWSNSRTSNPLRILAQGVVKTVTTCLLMVASLVFLQVEPLGYFFSLVIVQVSYLLALAPVFKLPHSD